jgi:hypothetical protein
MAMPSQVRIGGSVRERGRIRFDDRGYPGRSSGEHFRQSPDERCESITIVINRGHPFDDPLHSSSVFLRTHTTAMSSCSVVTLWLSLSRSFSRFGSNPGKEGKPTNVCCLYEYCLGSSIITYWWKYIVQGFLGYWYKLLGYRILVFFIPRSPLGYRVL